MAPLAIASLRRAIPDWLEDATNGLSARFRALLAALYRDLQWLDERVRELDQEIAASARDDEAVRRIEQLRGINIPRRTAENSAAVYSAIASATAREFFRSGGSRASTSSIAIADLGDIAANVSSSNR
ncbi:MAG: hypothetical protein IPJ97_13030 [Proteobacteria bacterium]|nr:hypothetical protein [Pseudomonadota bacterium]